MHRMLIAAMFLFPTLLMGGCSGDSPPAETATGDSAAEAQNGFASANTPPAAKRSSIDDTDGRAAASRATEPAEMAEGSSEASTASGGTSEETAETAKDTPPSIEIVPKTEEPEEPPIVRESLVGRWELALSDFGQDPIGLLLEVSVDEDTHMVKILDDSDWMSGWKVSSASIDEKTAAVQFLREDGKIVDFVGELDEDSIVRGNVIFGQAGLNLVRWLPTEAGALDSRREAVPSVKRDVMQGFRPDPANPFEDLRAKAEELGDVALGYQLCSQMTSLYRRLHPDAEAFEGFPEIYVKAARPWGTRAVARAQLDVARTMAICGYDPAAARTFIEAAEPAIDGHSPLQSLVKSAKALVYLHAESAEDQQTALTLAREIREVDPLESEVTRALAEYHERQNEPEQAVTYYAELAALPTGAGGMEPVRRLWDDLGRPPGALDEFLDDIYKHKVHHFAAPTSDAPRAQENPQTVLGELFTGAMCPPCVSADVATGALEITFPKTDLIMLRYHQHVPGPDPLTVADGDERAGYYRVPGTPTLFFNGQQVRVASMTGGIFNAPAAYEDLRGIMEPLLPQSSKLAIHLTASADGDEISIAAAISGVDEFPDSWRLRLCLAEEEIAFPAPNGIRLHEMVVRTMPGGPEGVAPSDGKLEFNGSVSLSDVRNSIADYVSQIPSLPLPPMELTHLHVVALVQDDPSREVLQATAVAVEAEPATAQTGSPKGGDVE